MHVQIQSNKVRDTPIHPVHELAGGWHWKLIFSNGLVKGDKPSVEVLQGCIGLA